MSPASLSFFPGRYEVENRDHPAHRSATCIVAFAEDQCAARDADDRRVALKVMKHWGQFNREIALRRRFRIGQAVLPILRAVVGRRVQESGALPMAADIGKFLLVMRRAEDDLSNYMARASRARAPSPLLACYCWFF